MNSNDGIEIPGFSPIQRELADRIWSMDTKEQMQQFFDSLPRRLQAEAHVVFHMIVLACIDQEPLDDCDEAREIIERVKYLP
jgi:hypothetical protein